jgi:hypothetical protein
MRLAGLETGEAGQVGILHRKELIVKNTMHVKRTASGTNHPTSHPLMGRIIALETR